MTDPWLAWIAPHSSPSAWTTDRPAGVEHRPASRVLAHAEALTDLGQGEPLPVESADLSDLLARRAGVEVDAVVVPHDVRSRRGAASSVPESPAIAMPVWSLSTMR